MRAMMVWLFLVVVVVGGVGCEKQDNQDVANANPDKPGKPKNEAKPKEDEGYKELIREWLRENLDSGKWEEVRWWAPRRLVKHRQTDINSIEGKIQTDQNTIKALKQNNPVDGAIPAIQRNITEYEASLKRAKARPAKIGARLKYRTENEAGITKLYDAVFYIEDGRAKPAFSDPKFTHHIVDDGDFD